MKRKVFTKILAVLFMAVLVVMVTPTSAAKPIVFREEVDISFPIWECDDYNIWGKAEGFFVVHILKNREITVVNVDVTYWSWSESPDIPIKSVSGPSHGVDIYNYEDGTLLVSTGLYFRTKTPDGQLIIEVGKIVWDPMTFEVFEAHGRKDLSDDYMLHQLCVLLAP